MKKKIVLFILCLLTIPCAMFFTGCTNAKFKLDFIVDNSVYYSIDTAGNEIIALPTNPTKDDFIFDGWFWDNNEWQRPFTANSLLNEPLSSDMKVYAKWINDNSPKNTQANFLGFTKENETTYSISLSNNTEVLNMSNVVEIDSRSSWKLTTDIQANNSIASKIATLNVGDNTYYVLVTAQNEDVKLYTIKIRRKPIYTVSFNGYADTQYVEEGSFATKPLDVERTGYTFNGWDFDFNNTINSNLSISPLFNLINYNIFYHLNGAINDSKNPLTYTIEDNVIFYPAIFENDTLGRWYSDELFQNKLSVILIGNTGNIDIYAKKLENDEKLLTIDNGILTKFNSELADELNLTSIIIPNCVNEIDSLTFSSNCSNLTSIVIPNSVTKIGLSTFENCYKLIEIYNLSNIDLNANHIVHHAKTIHSSIDEKSKLSVSNNVIYYIENNSKIAVAPTSYNLNEIVIDSDCTQINENAFYKFTNLTKVSIPGNVKEIGKFAFMFCNNLCDILLENGVEIIYEYAFKHCTSLMNITIPESINKIDFEAFCGCTNLSNATFSSSNNWIVTHTRFSPSTDDIELNTNTLSNKSLMAQYLSIQYDDYIWTKINN